MEYAKRFSAALLLLAAAFLPTVAAATTADYAFSLPESVAVEGSSLLSVSLESSYSRVGTALDRVVEAVEGGGWIRVSGGPGVFLVGDVLTINEVMVEVHAIDGDRLLVCERTGFDPAIEGTGPLPCSLVGDATSYSANLSVIGPGPGDRGRWLPSAGGWLRIDPALPLSIEAGDRITIDTVPSSDRALRIVQRLSDSGGNCLIAVVGESFPGGDDIMVGAAVTILRDRVRYVQWTLLHPDHGEIYLGCGKALSRRVRATTSEPWGRDADGTYIGDHGLPPGDYTIRCRVLDHAWQVHSQTTVLQVRQGAAPQARTAVFNQAGASGPPALLDGAASSDDVEIVNYRWDIDLATDSDGNGVPSDDCDIQGQRVEWLYQDAGSHTARLTVEDGAGQESQSDITVTVAEQAPPLVRCPTWAGSGVAPHPAVSGEPTWLMAVVDDADASTYSWDLGLGGEPTPPLPVPADGRMVVEATYVGEPGFTYTATCTVTDSSGMASSDTFVVGIREDLPATRQAIAIDRGCWWLMGERLENGLWYHHGNWGGSQQAAATASAIHALSLHGHHFAADPTQDPYWRPMRESFALLLSDLIPTQHYAANHATGRYTLGEPLNDANGNALEPSSIFDGYTVGIRIDCLVAAGHPCLRVSGGEERLSLADLLHDLMDSLVWGQTDGGGWDYELTIYRGRSDNSISQWPTVGLMALDKVYGLRPPAFVSACNVDWLVSSHEPITGAFGYDGPTSEDDANSLNGSHPGGLGQLTWQGFQPGHRWWRRGMGRLADGMDEISSSQRIYAYFSIFKALHLNQSGQIVMLPDGRDWWRDPEVGLRDRLLEMQEEGGGWPDTQWLRPSIGSAWVLMMFAPDLFRFQPSRLGNHRPVALARSVAVPTDPGKPTGSVSPVLVDDGSYDPDGDPISFALSPDGPFPVGEHTVQLVVSDSYRQQGRASSQVTVEDREPPVFAPFEPVTVACDPGLDRVRVAGLPRPEVSDNVGIAALDIHSAPSLYLGQHQITWIASDRAGNQSTAQQIVDVVDEEAPVIVAPRSLIRWLPAPQIELDQPDLGQPEVHDNVRVASVVNDALDSFPAGVTTVTWTATDPAGNSGQATQVVDIRLGGPAPTIELVTPGDQETFQEDSQIVINVALGAVTTDQLVRIEAYRGEVLVGSAERKPWQVVWTGLPAGTHELRARAVIDGGGGQHMVDSPVHGIHVEPVNVIGNETMEGD